MEKYFNCFNCKELINVVFESKCCGILYCHNCKNKLINTQCLKCDKPLELQRNNFAQRLLKNINVKCKYGCGLTLSYDKMQEHILTCDKKIYVCSFDNITNNKNENNNFKGYKKEIVDHMVKQHPKILLLFMENYKNFEKTFDKLLNKNVDKMNDDTILNISNNLNNLNEGLLNNDENDENTHIEFDHDIQLLNRINDLNLINSNINNFNDLHINNGINSNIPSFRINNSIHEKSYSSHRCCPGHLPLRRVLQKDHQHHCHFRKMGIGKNCRYRKRAESIRPVFPRTTRPDLLCLQFGRCVCQDDGFHRW